MQTSKQDWTQIDTDDEGEDYDVQEEEQQKPQEQEKHQKESHSLNQELSDQQGIRSTAYREDRGGRGNRRGRGRGDRRGGREDRDRNHRREQEQRPQTKNQASMESQPKQEMINLVNRARDDIANITIFNVDFKSNEENIKDIYKEVNFKSIKSPKPGVFILEFDRENALKFIDIGTKTLNGREFYMRLSYENRPQPSDDHYHGGKDRNRGGYNKQGGGYYEDKHRRNEGGERRNNNRRERDDYHSFKPKQHIVRSEGVSQSTQIEPDNKFFKGHDLKATEPTIKFINSSHAAAPMKKDEGSTENPAPKILKPNPFGEAKPRDENEYIKKKEEEKKEAPKSHTEDLKKQVEDTKKVIVKPEPKVEEKPETKPEQKDTKQPEQKVEAKRNITQPLVLDRHQSESVSTNKDRYQKGAREDDRRRDKRNDQYVKYDKYEKSDTYEKRGNYEDKHYKPRRDQYSDFDKLYEEYNDNYDNHGKYGKSHYKYEKEPYYKSDKGGRDSLQISHYKSEGGTRKTGGYTKKEFTGGFGGNREQTGGYDRNRDQGYGGGNRGGGSHIVYEVKEKQGENRNEKIFETKKSFGQGQNQGKDGNKPVRTKESSNKMNPFNFLQ